MHVVMAPDSFRGTLSAPEAAAAMADGWRRHAPDDTVTLVPMSDGGAGVVEAVRAALPGSLVQVTVPGPDGAPVPAAVLLVAAADDPSGRASAYVDLSHALGEHLVVDAPAGDAAGVLRRTSRGAGRLVGEAVGTGAERVVVGAGRAGVLDGGAGLLTGLAETLLDGTGHADPAPPGLAAAAQRTPGEVAHLALLRERLTGVELVLATDRDSPLVGRHGPVQASGRDLGVPAASLPSADAAMTAWAAVLVEAAGAAGAPDPGRLVALPGAGA
ncbi:glycerate kinase, partial [Aquipuribacter sp. SD81]|uniref:glycerate kinase n=1 Tax=Aquipuribacter sp. SD81 TaxID=3127703 RepID=UPI003015FD7B